MEFVRVHEQEADKANSILDSAIGKLNELSSSQNRVSSSLSGDSDVLSSLILSSLASKSGEISSIIGQINALKGAISAKAKELDDEEYKKWLAEQRKLEEARKKKKEEEK